MGSRQHNWLARLTEKTQLAWAPRSSQSKIGTKKTSGKVRHRRNTDHITRRVAISLQKYGSQPHTLDTPDGGKLDVYRFLLDM